jgi:hypothetical protein
MLPKPSSRYEKAQPITASRSSSDHVHLAPTEVLLHEDLHKRDVRCTIDIRMDFSDMQTSRSPPSWQSDRKRALKILVQSR